MLKLQKRSLSLLLLALTIIESLFPIPVEAWPAEESILTFVQHKHKQKAEIISLFCPVYYKFKAKWYKTLALSEGSWFKSWCELEEAEMLQLLGLVKQKAKQVTGLVPSLGDLSLISRTHAVEGENYLPQIVLQLCTCANVCACVHTYKHTQNE